MHVRMEHVAEHEEPQAHAPYPGTDGYDNLPQFPAKLPVSFRRTIRRHELHQIGPLAETTIYEMEQRGEFPQRFYLTSRCVVWDLGEVEAWLEERRRASRAKAVKRAKRATKAKRAVTTRAPKVVTRAKRTTKATRK